MILESPLGALKKWHLRMLSAKCWWFWDFLAWGVSHCQVDCFFISLARVTTKATKSQHYLFVGWMYRWPMDHLHIGPIRQGRRTPLTIVRFPWQRASKHFYVMMDVFIQGHYSILEIELVPSHHSSINCNYKSRNLLFAKNEIADWIH